MTVDLEEEQDPPAFKAARRKDKERLLKVCTNLHLRINNDFTEQTNPFQMTEEEVESFSELQKQIEMQLEHDRQRRNLPNRKYVWKNLVQLLESGGFESGYLQKMFYTIV